MSIKHADPANRVLQGKIVSSIFKEFAFILLEIAPLPGICAVEETTVIHVNNTVNMGKTLLNQEK